jgi:5-deoxy-glucuronate isomerase
MKYHYKSQEILQRINPQDMGLEYTSVQRLEFPAMINFDTQEEEVCLVCIEGEAQFTSSEHTGTIVMKDVLYVPAHSSIKLSSSSKAAIIRYGAPSDLKSEFAHIQFANVDANPNTHHVYGKVETNSQRDVWNFIDEKFNSSRFLVGMCESNIGSWTAWPPHEHGDKREEVYIYFNMGHAFGIQCLYEELGQPLEVALVQDGDLVSIPQGYHPNVGCPGGKLSYVYCMVSKKTGDRSFMDLNIQKIFGDKFE